MFCKEHGGFARHVLLDHHWVNPRCGTWALENQQLERGALRGFPGNIPGDTMPGGTDSSAGRRHGDQGCSYRRRGQLLGWGGGLGFYNLLPGAEEMLACSVETFHPSVFHRSQILTLVVGSWPVGPLTHVCHPLPVMSQKWGGLAEANRKGCAVSKSQFRISPTL